jgi:DNA-binding SARP family transcriptional activator
MTPALPQRRVRIRLFGTIEVESPRGRLGARDFGGPKPKQLLEILLLARGHPVSKDRLADLIWGERLPRKAPAALENYVSVLRKRLSPDRRRGRELIVTEHEAYRFAIAQAEIDLDRFDELLEQAERRDGPAARDALEEAIGLARGDLLEDEPYAEWAEEARRRYRERLVQALVRAAKTALVDDDYSTALDRAERALATEPDAEAACVAAMLALHALSRTHEAILLFERFARALADDVGAEPAGETRALRDAIRRREDPRTLLVAHVGHASTRRPPTPLVGRAEQLSALVCQLRDALAGSGALVLVEGEAGVGKSRLLDEALRRLPPVRIGRGRCSPLEHDLPYMPLAMALREALADIELGDEPRHALAPILPELRLSKPPRRVARLTTLESLAQLLQEHAPLVLMLDDLHWADESSVVALDYLQRRLAGASVAVVGAFRPEELSSTHPLLLLAPTARIALASLGPEALEQLGVPGLYELTLGHPPLVALALADARARVPPPALVALVEARCRSEGPRGYRALATASVLEQPFEPQVLAVLLGEDPAELTELLERLCDRRLLRVEGDAFGYPSQPLRDALFATLSPARRRLLAQRARLASEQRVPGTQLVSLP